MDKLKIVSGVTLSPPSIGRIAMGHTELRGSGDDARGLPQKDDHFTITTLTQNRDRSWELHPIMSKLPKDASGKLTAIPVIIAYNDPNLSVHNRNTCFDPRTGRTLCAGNGTTAKRMTAEGVQTIECVRPDSCEFGIKYRCKPMTRFYVRIQGQDDELGRFVLRTTSYNTLERLAGRLSSLAGMTHGMVAGMPMMLTINSKTSAMSFRQPFWYADLVQRDGMSLRDAVKAAKTYQEENLVAGISQDGLEDAIRQSQSNSDFADEIEDLDEWVSDEDLAGAAASSLQRQGLRGMDSVVASLANGNAMAVATKPLVETPAGAPATAAETVPAAAQVPAAENADDIAPPFVAEAVSAQPEKAATVVAPPEPAWAAVVSAVTQQSPPPARPRAPAPGAGRADHSRIAVPARAPTAASTLPLARPPRSQLRPSVPKPH